jgi:hypothetical protein
MVKRSKYPSDGALMTSSVAILPPGARSVFDDDWLTESFRQSLGHQARDDVGLETGR